MSMYSVLAIKDMRDRDSEGKVDGFDTTGKC